MAYPDLYNSTKRKRKAIVITIWTVCIATVTILMTLKLLGLIELQCPIYKYTGYQCPSCGMTRAIRAIINGRLDIAFKYNGFIMTTWIIPIVLLIRLSIEYVTELNNKKTLVFLVAYMVLLISYGVLRNYTNIN